MDGIGGGETLETLRVVIEATTRPYREELDRVRTATAQATDRVERETAKMSKAFSKVGSAIKMALGAVSIGAITSFAKSCIDLGSDLAEVQNVVDVTFGSMSSEVDKFAKNAIAQFGLSETVAKKYMGTYGAMAKAFGLNTQQAYDMSAAITGLTGDVASFYNLSTDEAYTKLKSIFTGETESLKDLGVVMTQTALDQYALNNGFGKTTAKMTEQEKVMLRYQFVMAQLGIAQGDFARTSDGWANQTRVLQLRFDQLRATIGQGLINALTPVLKILNGIIERLQVAAQAFTAFTAALFGKSTQQSTNPVPKQDIGGGSDLADSTGQAADNTGDIAGNLKDGAEQAKKIQLALMGFDQINKLSSPLDDADTPSSGGAETPSIPGYAGLDGSVLSDVNKELDDINKNAEKAAKKLKDFLKGVKEAAEPTTRALKKLWDEGLSKLGNFTWTAIKDFWNNFLKPMGKWILGDKGLPRFFNITNDLLNKIDWPKLNKSLANLFNELKKPTKFVWTALMDFYEGFLVPVGLWVMGEGLPKFYDLCSKLISKIDWDELNEALKILWDALGPFAAAIGRGLVSFIETMAKILTPIIATILSGIASALKILADAINSIPAPVAEAIGGAIGGICTALLGFKAVNAVVGIISGAKAAMSGLLSAIVAHPVAAIIIGVAGLAGALVSFSNATMKDPEFDKWSSGMDDLNDSLKQTNDEVQRRLDQADKWKDAGEAEVGAAKIVAEEYYKLAEKADLTNAEKERMKRLSEDLIKMVPELETSYNKETGLITAKKEEVQNLIDKMLEQYKLEAAKESLIEYERARLQSYEAVSKASEEVSDSVKMLKEKEDALNAAQQENAKQNEALGLSAASLTPEVVKLKDQVAEAKEKLDSNKESMRNMMDKYNESQASIDTVTEYMYGMGDAVDNTGKKADGLTKAYAVMIDDVGGIFENGKQVMGQKAIDIYKGIEEGLYKDNGKGVYDVGNGIMVQFGNSFEDKKPEIKSMVEEIGKESVSALNSGAEKEISSSKEKMKTNFRGWAAYSAAGYKDKIQEMESDFVKTMRGFAANGIAKPFADELEINSPSKLFGDYAKYVGQGFSNNLESAFSKAFDFFGDIKEKVSSSVGDLSGTGKSAIQSFADGFQSIHIPTPRIDIGWEDWSVGNLTFSVPKFNGVSWYARGGFPANGEMFMANEAGPEMIGKMGNRNVVANNKQITEGIKAAVVDGMMEVAAVMGDNSNNSSKTPVIEFTLMTDSETFYKIVRKGKQKYENRYDVVATI